MRTVNLSVRVSTLATISMAFLALIPSFNVADTLTSRLIPRFSCSNASADLSGYLYFWLTSTNVSKAFDVSTESVCFGLIWTVRVLVPSNLKLNGVIFHGLTRCV